MRNIKKLIALTLCLFMIVPTLFSCANGETNTSETETTNNSETETAAETATETETETEKLTEVETEGKKIIKIACIGDSITYGVGAKNTNKDNYLGVLETMISDEYELKNFGLSGSSLIIRSKTPYLKSKEYSDCLEYNPDIVIIMLGTNDALSQGTRPKFEEQYTEDANTLIETLNGLESKPRIFFMTSPDIIGYPEQRSYLVNKLLPTQKKIAEDNGFTLIDIFAATEENASLFTDDGVHPNNDGYKVIAQTVYDVLSVELGFN